MCSCVLTVSAGRAGGSTRPRWGQHGGRCSMTRSGSWARVRLWPSCPGLAPPGRACSRRCLRSVEGGLEEVREVFSGRCSRSTSSISSSWLKRSRSARSMTAENQPKACRARAGHGRGTYRTLRLSPTSPPNPLGNYLGVEPIELWGGLECTVVRIRDEFRNQITDTGHHHRPADLDAIAALGIQTLRYPVV